MTIVPVVVDHALNNPFFIDSRIQETFENFTIESRKISIENKPIRIFNFGVNILYNYGIIINKLKHFHDLFQIWNELNFRIDRAIDINFSFLMFQLFFMKTSFHNAYVFAVYSFGCLEGVYFESIFYFFIFPPLIHVSLRKHLNGIALG